MFLIKDGRMIDPKTKKDDIIDVIVKEGIIYRIGKYQINDDYEFVIDAKGKIVAPGLVHVHFRDPGFTYKEDICTGAKAAARGGFTTVICMANTNPVVDNIETLNCINEKAAKAKIHVLQTAAITKGLNGKELINMEAMKEAGAVGFSDDYTPHSKEEKDRNLVDAPSGITGLETSLALGVTNLVRKGHLTIMQLLEKMTVNPAELYGLESGTITQGARADLVIFDPSENWVVKDFESKSTNSPFVEQSLYGKIKYTICDGNIVYRDVE